MKHVSLNSQNGCLGRRIDSAALAAARGLTGVLMAIAAILMTASSAVGQAIPAQPVDMTPTPSRDTSSSTIYRAHAWHDSGDSRFTVRLAKFEQADRNAESAQKASSETPFLVLDAAAETTSEVTPTAESLNDNGRLSQLGLWTVIVLCLAVLTILGIRRWQRSRGMLPTGRQTGRIIDTLALGPGRSVSLIQIQGLQALVGCDSTGIRTIALATPMFSDEMQSVITENDVADESETTERSAN